jgi:hypothetical protein
MLHHDNVPDRTSFLIRSYLAKYQTPDLAPAKFFLFPKLKTTLKLSRFKTIEEIQENEIREMRTITKSAFQEPFQQ